MRILLPLLSQWMLTATVLQSYMVPRKVTWSGAATTQAQPVLKDCSAPPMLGSSGLHGLTDSVLLLT